MTPDLQKEFQKLHEDALQKLRGIGESGGIIRLFTLFIEPSFTPCQSLTLYAPRPILKKKEDGIVKHAIWRSDIDAEKFRDPVERLRHGRNIEPTIEFNSWNVEGSIISSISDRLSSIAIPIFIGTPTRFGTDGTSYKFEYDQLFYSISLKWWEEYPAEWHPFTEAVMEIYKMLTRDGHRPPPH